MLDEVGCGVCGGKMPRRELQFHFMLAHGKAHHKIMGDAKKLGERLLWLEKLAEEGMHGYKEQG